MGRLRIKKKETVLPFRETVAYRMILLAASLLGFLIAAFVVIGALQSGSTGRLIASSVIAAGLAFLVVYNLDRLRTARIPKHTLNKMKRR